MSRYDKRLPVVVSSPAVVALAFLVNGCSRPADSAAGEPPPLFSHGPPPGFFKRPLMSTVIRLPDGPATRVMFIGNSLTGANELPRMVQAMAAAAGRRLEFNACLGGGVNLEDHWKDGRCLRLLREDSWDYLVLQQGPSTLPASQAELRKWSERWADEARKQKARPALYMVWPPSKQADGFALVRQSYAKAARESHSLLFSAGTAWERALTGTSDISLYERDGLHPTLAGTYLASLLITRGLIGKKADLIPDRLEIATGRLLDLPESTCRRLQRIAQSVQDSLPQKRAGFSIAR